MIIALEKLNDGMVLGQDVSNSQGRVLLRAGTTIAAQQRQLLRSSGIRAVDIHDPHAAKPANVHLDRAVVEAAAIIERRRFRHCDLAQAELYSLFAQGVKRRALERNEPQAPPPPAISAGEAIPDLTRLIESVRQVQSLPDSYRQIDAAVHDSTASAQDIAAAIGRDQAMTLRVLRLANSSLYAFPGRVEDITRAVTIIGTRQIRELALATAVLELFRDIDCQLVSMRSFWIHAMARACYARLLAVARHELNAERHFVAGLLAGIGRLILLLQLPQRMATLITCCQAGTLLHELESATFGYNTADVGAALLQRWQLPSPLVEAVRAQYHDPERSRHPLEPALIAVGRLLAGALGHGGDGEYHVVPLTGQAWSQAGYQAESLPAMITEVDLQVHDLNAIFLDTDQSH